MYIMATGGHSQSARTVVERKKSSHGASTGPGTWYRDDDGRTFLAAKIGLEREGHL